METAAARLGKPAHPLHGKRRPALPLPENLICFQRRAGVELNRPTQGRALHHRHVLIVALKGKATICADDQEMRLAPGEGLVVMPYQHHHYTSTTRRMHWLFVTFEYAQGVVLEPLRNSAFKLTSGRVAQLVDLVNDWRARPESGLPELRLALLLADLAPSPDAVAAGAAATLKPQVNYAIQQRRPVTPTIRELAADLGMSQSHLRARFQASCGVSLGRHMRELRLERARGLLRMSAARVSEVAEQCGFSSLFSFSRAFKTRYGESPLTCRKRAAA
ncbi:MAG: AraC family transcriptional regulator [Burkholderiales bacterium]|nr:AraC family transcriptional regulator [Opitutaceae bacterium]